MAKGYWIVHVDVTDAEAYKTYVPLSSAAVAAHGGRFLVRGGQGHTVEGDLGARHVVVEFPSLEAAQAAYRSPEYAKALPIRQANAVSNVVIVEGVDAA
jgi:uncharacterized protein (DUF1330 family)